MAEIGIRMQCPKCMARMYQPADEDGDWACRICSMRVYAGHDPSEEYWKQLQAQIAVAPQPQVMGGKGRRKGSASHNRYRKTA